MKSQLILTTLLLTTVVGCTDKKAATTGNFEASINDFLAYGRNCIVYDAAFSMLPSAAMSANNGYDALVGSGWISKTPAPNQLGQGSLFIYDLTAKAKATKTTVRFGDKLLPGYLCSGKLSVDVVSRFTEPAEEHGQRESQVTFTTKLVDVPDWLKSSPLAGKFGPTPTKPDSSVKDKATMVLTSDGWKVDGRLQEVNETQ